MDKHTSKFGVIGSIARMNKISTPYKGGHSLVKIYKPDKTTGKLKYIESVDPFSREYYETIKVTHRTYPYNRYKQKKRGGE